MVMVKPKFTPDSDMARQPLPVNTVSLSDIPKWLRLGYEDCLRIGFPSLAHGLIVTLAGMVILSAGWFYWPVLPGAVSGFILVGPVLATGLYALSRSREHDGPTRLGEVGNAWRKGGRRLFVFNLVLIAAATAWVAVSLLFFHFFIKTPIDGPPDFLRYVITQNDHLFLLWAIAGGIGTALLFAITVVSVPLIFDREVDTLTAILTSVRAVGDNPHAMAGWALVIAAVTGLCVATLLVGFIIAYPIMGHASWHAYRDLVDRQEPAARS
jgi:uncharacterized membrane protein